MRKGNSIKSFIFFSRTGCLLPLLIILNLFFGWIFLRLHYWLLTELILILLFVINGYIITRKINAFASKHDTEVPTFRSNVFKRKVLKDNVIDVEGKVVEDKEG